MKKQLPVFKWTRTEWEILNWLRLCKNDISAVHANMNAKGHNMKRSSVKKIISKIRRKMYEYSKHLAPSMDSVLEAQQEDCTNKFKKRIKALEDQCKRADEIIYTKQDTINHMVKKNESLTGRILILEELAVSGPVILKAFCGGILLSAAIGYALLVLGVIHV